MSPDEIRERWIARREEFQRFHVQVDGAALVDELLEDLKQLAAATGAIALTLRQASERTGYTTDSLSRLIRQGKLTNVGRRGAPRVLVSELPKRPASKLADRSTAPYDGATDARLLRIRR
ncbi:MAG: hypothetical protein H0T48_13815 [Gemmatimonadaceae bacterium]|nr:hypothetical protein [Gemmatimonadaceae bacterium]